MPGYTFTGGTFAAGPFTVSITMSGVKFEASEPGEVVLPWNDGGMEFSEWIGRLIE